MKHKSLVYSIIIVAAIIIAYMSFYYLSNSGPSLNFQVDSVMLKTAIKLNSGFETFLRVSNTDSSVQHFKIKTEGLDGMVSIDKTEFVLESGETERIKVSFSNNKQPYGIYTGDLLISSDKSRGDVPLVLEIESDEVSFDSNIALFPTEEISPGDKINAEIKIFDLSRIGTANVEMEYFVKNLKGEILMQDKETPVVKSQALVTKSVNLPKDIEIGNYIFGVVLRYKNSVGTSSAVFSVEKKNSIGLFPAINWTYLVVTFIVLFIALFVILFEYERRKMRDVVATQEKDIKRISKNLQGKKINTKDLGNISHGLEEKLDVLRRAYDSGYISRNSYVKGKKRLEDMKKKLKKKYL